MRCMILGGCGFIGSHLADLLLKKGCEVRIFDRNGIDCKNINHIRDQIELFEGNFGNLNDLKEGISGVDYIFHLISTTHPKTSFEDPSFDVTSNVLPTINLLSYLVKRQTVKKIIFASSGGTVYGPSVHQPISESHPTFPISPYGLSKLIIEKYLHFFYTSFGLDYTIFRASNAYGEKQNILSNQGVISIFLNNLKQGKKIHIWGDGSIERDYIYVKDLSDAFIMGMESSIPATIYNLGSGTGTTLLEIIEVITTITGYKPNTCFEKGRIFDVHSNILRIQKIQKELNWKPSTSLAEGIEATWEYIKNQSQ